MCGPFLPVVAGAISAVGSLASGFMSMKAGDANAKAYNQQAKNREEKAKYDSAQAITRYERVRGQTVAGIGTTGLDPASFSDALADGAIESALEVKAIKWQGDVEAANLRFQAATAKYQGKAAMIGSVFQAAGAFAGGVGRGMGMSPMQAGGTTVGYQPWGYSVSPRFSA